MPRKAKQPEVTHGGLRPDRNDLYPERIFAEAWAELNQRQPGHNGDCTALELILNTEPLLPGGMLLVVGRAEGDVMYAAGT